MLTLGISTSSGQFAIVLGEENRLIFHSDDLQLSDKKDLAALMSKCIENSERSIHEISSIIVDIGPGGTSRVRTGVAFANSLAYSLGISVCPVSSMELAGIEAWEKYSLPVINTVKSIGGNAYVGLYNQDRLISVEYGSIANILPKMIDGIKELAVVGYHRDYIVNLLSNCKVLDSGLLYGNAALLIYKSSLFIKQALKFPHIAIPVTEKVV
jgi:tRNA A37 threonylcarbamoyladenosine modification protein TsaB